VTAENEKSAEFQCGYIKQIVKDFEKGLDKNTEIAIKLASFGQSVTISVETIEYRNPSLIIFNGFIGSNSATLIQNVSQLSFFLLAQQKEPGRNARRIGFL